MLLNDAARVGPTLEKKSLNFSAMILLSEMICPSVTIDFMLFRLLCFLLSIFDILSFSYIRFVVLELFCIILCFNLTHRPFK